MLHTGKYLADILSFSLLAAEEPETQSSVMPFFKALLERVQDQTIPSLPSMAETLDTIKDIHWLLAAVVCMLGAFYLLSGLKVYKLLMMFDGAIVGTILGGMVVVLLDKSEWIWYGMIGGGVVMGALAWPLSRVFVILLGGACGAIGAAVLLDFMAWKMDMTDLLDYKWIAAIAGAILFAIFFLFVFRFALIMLTTIQGAFMLIFGALRLVMRIEDIYKPLSDKLIEQPSLLLLAIGGLFLMGLSMQLSYWMGLVKTQKAEAERAALERQSTQHRPI
jgi:hypothetical protein